MTVVTGEQLETAFVAETVCGDTARQDATNCFANSFM